MENPIKIFAIPTKSCDVPYFNKILLKFIKKQYGGNVVGKYTNKIEELQKTRKSFTNIQNAQDTKKFIEYSQIADHIGRHFPINSGAKKLKISFTWYDSLSRRKVSNPTTQWESCNTLFVVGSLLTQQGCLETRTTPESAMKAAKKFKQAAGYFTLLKEEKTPKLLGKTTVDMHGETLGVLSDICLAHAQQCVLEKAILSKMKRNLCSMLAFELSAMWKDSYARMCASTVKECFNKEWKNMALFKQYFYGMYANYLLGLQHYVDTEVGKSCARLKECEKLLGKCSSLRLHPKLKENLTHMKEIFEKKQKEVEYDNEKVYFEVVPSLASLGEIKRKRIVKPDEIKLPKVDDPFKELFPIHVMEAMKKYTSDLNTKLTRALRSTQLHREHIKNTLAKQGLPGSVMAQDTSMSGFPIEIHNKIQKINKSGGVGKLTNYRKTLTQMAVECNNYTKAVLKLLTDEEQDDLQMRRTYGMRWNRLPSGQLTLSLKKHLNDCIGKVNQAAQADGLIDNKLKQYNAYFSRFTLSKQQLDALLPKNESGKSGTNKAATQLIALLKQMDGLYLKEEQIEAGVKNLQKSEDVNSKFMSSSDVNAEIGIQLSKYDVELKKLGVISAQEDQLLQTILQSNQYFLQTKQQQKSGNTERAKQIQAMYFAINKYDEVLGNINQGLTFYCDMQEFVKKLKRKVQDFVFTRNIEKKDVIANLSQQLTYVPQQYGFQAQPQQQQQYQPQQQQYGYQQNQQFQQFNQPQTRPNNQFNPYNYKK